MGKLTVFLEQPALFGFEERDFLGVMLTLAGIDKYFSPGTAEGNPPSALLLAFVAGDSICLEVGLNINLGIERHTVQKMLNEPPGHERSPQYSLGAKSIEECHLRL